MVQRAGRLLIAVAVVAVAVFAVACEGGQGPPADGALAGDADAAVVDAPAADAPAADAPEGDAPIDLIAEAAAGCTAGETRCLAPKQQEVCKAGSGGATAWVAEACAAGTLCLDKTCSAECTDQCDLGQSRASGAKTETCKLFSVAQNAAVPPSTGMHDRAREYNAWLRKHHLPAGLNSAYFADAKLTKVAVWYGTGDSALWTGAYLAAEALRHEATGSPDAQKNMQRVVEYVHRLFKVSGHKGYMVRYTAPVKNSDPRIDAIYDKTHPDFNKVTYKGTDYFYRGGTSRDAFQGPILGLSMAYEQLTSAAHKQLAREVLVDLATELIKARKGVKITVSFKLGGQSYKLPFNADLQYVVLNPDEYIDGGPAFTVDTSDVGSSSVAGIREFFPDWAVFLKQVPLLGTLFSFPVYRSGSTIMLAAILRAAMIASKGVPAYAAQHAAISAHYNAKIKGWIKIMKLNVYTNTTCWEKYYGLNITFMPIFNLVRMESDPTLRAALHNDVLVPTQWSYVKAHKNAWFSYIYGASAPAGAATKAVVDAASAQLKLFGAAPNVDRSVDNTAKYSPNPACPGQTKTAVNANERWSEYFCWQKHPFYLTHKGNPQHVWPGVDYLLPYWLGRARAFLADDAKGTCLRWMP